MLTTFADRVLSITVATADAWGRLPRARTLPVVDSLLLASAAEHGLTFVSREADRYADVGVPRPEPVALIGSDPRVPDCTARRRHG